MKVVKLSLIALAILLPVTAYADDFNPPSWRGNPGTTIVQYEFFDDLTEGGTIPQGPYFPDYDFVFNPYGDPSIEIIPGPGAGWLPSVPGSQGEGWWNLSGDLWLDIPNRPETSPFKQIWIQLTWQEQAPGNRPFVQVKPEGGEYTQETTIPLVETKIYDGGVTGLDIYHTVFHLDIIPNPMSEIIHIFGGVNVDELVVDTWCVPEPMSMSLLGLGGLLLRRRK